MAMHTMIGKSKYLTWLVGLLATATVGVEASPLPQNMALAPRGSDTTTVPYSLPFKCHNTTKRAQGVETKRDGWLYGPPVVGNTSYYPTGTLANKTTTEQTKTFNAYQDTVTAGASLDALEAAQAIRERGGIKSLDEYHKLYDGLWTRSAPDGPMDGMLSNYTSDLLFSMERLSVSPASLVRVQAGDKLPFTVENAKSITNMTVEELQCSGRLFMIDYLHHKDFPMSQGKYAAACQALFYMHPETDDFLPLAIKPNNEASDLVFTPEDDENDWMLAKMLFTMNDFWYIEWYHFAAEHCTSEIVYLAAIRTLSEDHPLMAVLHRLMKLAWSTRPAGVTRLLYNGGPVDVLYPWSGDVAANYTTSLYKSGWASSWQANYFETDLQARGLINSHFGPKLKHFPYYEDASVIMAEFRTFMTCFVHSYYKNPKMIEEDIELQNWVKEAGPAEIFDFPDCITTYEDLIEVMTMFSFLVSIEHGVLNTNSPVASTASFPLHPAAFYQPLPTEKGTIKDIMPFMPSIELSLGQISLLASFNRPNWEDTPNDLSHMFDDAPMLARLNDETRAANDRFKMAMDKFSHVVSSRTFDENGLIQGMPFHWDALDPNKASFFLTI